MNKEYLTRKIRERYDELIEVYSNACENKTPDGKAVKQKTASVQRTLAKRDLGIIILIDLLLKHMPDDFILVDEDAIMGFNRLVMPNKKGA